MTKIEYAANIAVILTCVATVAYMAHGARPDIPQTYKPGETISDSTELGLRGSKRTLIMFESSTCHFCNDSLPFSSLLSRRAQTSGVRIVALTPENPDTNRAFLQAHGVTINAVAELRTNRLKVSGTPTLILVGRDGIVLGSWVGKLQPEKEAEVIAKIVS